MRFQKTDSLCVLQVRRALHLAVLMALPILPSLTDLFEFSPDMA
jgi:hypothetical protein